MRMQDTQRELLSCRLQQQQQQRLPEPSPVRQLFTRQGCRYVELAMACRHNRLKLPRLQSDVLLDRAHMNTAPRREVAVDVWAENISCQIGPLSLLAAGVTPHVEACRVFFCLMKRLVCLLAEQLKEPQT